MLGALEFAIPDHISGAEFCTAHQGALPIVPARLGVEKSSSTLLNMAAAKSLDVLRPEVSRPNVLRIALL